MRWKAHFFLNDNINTEEKNEKFGLPSNNCGPAIKEMKHFEEDLLHLVSNISFKKVNDPFLNKINDDLKKVNSSVNVFVFADKTNNVYEVSPKIYNNLLTENITKSYKHGDNDVTDYINEELRDISNHFSIGNRIDIMAERNAFITLKDHKENFSSNPKCRLINPAKSELGKVSKTILDNINTSIRSSINVNQWTNSQSVIQWFQNINNKPKFTFLSFDIVEFYPSITEDLLNRVLSWAKTLTSISDDHIAVIHHARKSLLFNGNTAWVKRNNESLFDVTMGSYDGAEICELVGLFILNKLADKFGRDNVGLYRDDGLVLLKGTSGRLADKARKELHNIFQEFDLKITAEVNHQVVNFLDVTLDLKDDKFTPYRKPNNDPLYVDSRSNHPPTIIKQIPSSINKRISSLSSDKASFDYSAPFYESALKQSNYNVSLQYSPTNSSNSPSKRRMRYRNVIWFNPPFSKTVRTNIARQFLQLIDKHFPKTSSLHKIFNRNTIKVSYSCMENVKTSISRHNNRVLSDHSPARTKTCGCQRAKECPLNGHCKIRDVVYKAEITTLDDGIAKEYVGMTSSQFKERYRNHMKSFNNKKYSKETELSKYVWKLKDCQRRFTIKWSILRRARAYSPGGKRCPLCLEEKLFLMHADRTISLNKRSEIFGKCRHRDKFRAGNFARAQKQIASANR